MKPRNKYGQQEIVGFVLIVVLVMVALMVFLIIAVKDSVESNDNAEVSNILSVVMKTTTECAIVYEPDYDTFEDLFKSCNDDRRCSNLDVLACDYLNDSLQDVVSSMLSSDGMVDGWEIDFSEREGAGILRWSEGNCSGEYSGAQRSIDYGSIRLVVSMRIC